jgi:hypothetical protein
MIGIQTVSSEIYNVPFHPLYTGELGRCSYRGEVKAGFFKTLQAPKKIEIITEYQNIINQKIV